MTHYAIAAWPFSKPKCNNKYFVVCLNDFETLTPFKQGPEKHSSISTSQTGPANPEAHSQMKLLDASKHFPPF